MYNYLTFVCYNSFNLAQNARDYQLKTMHMPDINLGLSEVANIILSLLLMFQWYRDRARESAVKNGLFAVREMVTRTNTPSSQDILDALDANLATLGARQPYIERCRATMESILKKFQSTDDAPLSAPSPMQAHHVLS